MDLWHIILSIACLSLGVNAWLMRRKLKQTHTVVGKCASTMSELVVLVQLGQSTVDSLLKASNSTVKELSTVKQDLESFKQAVADFSVSITERIVALSEPRKETRSAVSLTAKKNDKEKPN
jgi:uncharacterized protein YoxC